MSAVDDSTPLEFFFSLPLYVNMNIITVTTIIGVHS